MKMDSQRFLGNFCRSPYSVQEDSLVVEVSSEKMLRCAARRLVSPYLRGSSTSLGKFCVASVKIIDSVLLFSNRTST